MPVSFWLLLPEGDMPDGPIPDYLLTIQTTSAPGTVHFSSTPNGTYASQYRLTPTQRGKPPTLLYAHAGEETELRKPLNVSLTIIVTGPPTATATLSLDMQVEGRLRSQLRRTLAIVTTANAVATALLTALAGFTVQQWGRLREEQQIKADLRERAALEIKELIALLRQDQSQGARRYLELRNATEASWRSLELGNFLEDVWQNNADKELQDFIRLTRLVEDKEAIPEADLSEYRTALEWAYRYLDEEWQEEVEEIYKEPNFSSKRMSEELADRRFRSILEAWPLSFSAKQKFEGDALVAYRPAKILGNERAETDYLLFPAQHKTAFSDQLVLPVSTCIIGEKGIGKTAAALLFVRDIMFSTDRELRQFFPVYHPVRINRHTPSDYIEVIADSVARTLLHYLTSKPRIFLTLKQPHQSAIAYLWSKYCTRGSGLPLRLFQAGLPDSHSGNALLMRLEQLLEGVSNEIDLVDEDILYMLSKAYPCGPDGDDFSKLLLLLDVQDGVGKSWQFQPFLKAVRQLTWFGVTVKVFASSMHQNSLKELDLTKLEFPKWSDDDLEKMLNRRLESRFGVVSIKALCDQDAKTLLPHSLLAYADGNASLLIGKANELLVQSDGDIRKLTAEDVETILPLPTPG
jgi:hypothetical protein